MSRTLDRALGEFTEMPTVAGDPIVESGSNSDGEWTRWADGSQRCSKSLSVGPWSANASASTIWTYPASFSEAPVSGATIGSSSPHIYNASVNNSTATQEIVYAGGSNGATGSVRVVANGYWK